MARALLNQPGGWLPFAWEEFVGRDASHGASFATGWNDGSQATFQILIGWLDASAAEVAILGYARFDSSTGRLTRLPPVRHPLKPSFYAERIVSAQPVHWNSKANSFANGYITGTTGAPLSAYSYWLLTIGFAQPKYRVMTDAQLLAKYGAMQEWQRFCEVHTHNGTQQISREGGNWQWLDGGGGGPTIGDKLVAPIGVEIYTGEITVVWKRVPRKGLFANNGDYDYFNRNILGCRNRVHNGATNLWGFQSAPPAGLEAMTSNANTGPLRFVDPDATPIPSPFDPNVQGLALTDNNLYYDVSFKFNVWQPLAGNTANQGHNLAPAPNNRWYLIGSNPGSNTIYQTTDLSALFTLSST